jgi:hypothetical protein
MENSVENDSNKPINPVDATADQASDQGQAASEDHQEEQAATGAGESEAVAEPDAAPEEAPESPSAEEDVAEQSAAASTDDEADGQEDEDPDSMESLMDMYEESFKRFAEGEVVTGKIISIDKDHVLVDIGYKSEGQIRIHEFKDENGEVQAQVDDSIEVMVEWWDDENEVVV